MPGTDDFQVRITKSGEVFVRVTAGDEERIRDYRRFIEENIGPVTAIEISNVPDWELPAGYSRGGAQAQQKEQEQQGG